MAWPLALLVPGEALLSKTGTPEAQEGAVDSGSEFLLTALGEKKDLKNVFFLVYQLSPARSSGVGGRGGVQCRWHLQAGFGFLAE